MMIEEKKDFAKKLLPRDMEQLEHLKEPYSKFGDNTAVVGCFVERLSLLANRSICTFLISDQCSPF